MRNGTTFKVFLAEDEIVVREGIRNTIPWESTNFTLAGEAPDGEIALQLIEEVKPDILITDIKMPFMDGLELSRHVRETYPWIKIIILSGHDEFEYARQAISIGVEEYLLKPVSSQDMIAALEKIARRLEEEHGRADTALPSIDGDILWARFRYASRKDVDDIIASYDEYLSGGKGDAEFLRYFIFGEIIVAAARLVEEFNGNPAEFAPITLNRGGVEELVKSGGGYREKLRQLFNALIAFRDSHTGGRYQSVILKAKEYIDGNYADPDVSLHTVAGYVGISPNHLSTVFAQETGENFIDYLTRVRLDKAKMLLLGTAMKSADIAAVTGFSDPHYFSFIFKKHSGLSPREFRNKSNTSP